MFHSPAREIEPPADASVPIGSPSSLRTLLLPLTAEREDPVVCLERGARVRQPARRSAFSSSVSEPGDRYATNSCSVPLCQQQRVGHRVSATRSQDSELHGGPQRQSLGGVWAEHPRGSFSSPENPPWPTHPRRVRVGALRCRRGSLRRPGTQRHGVRHAGGMKGILAP